MRASCATGAGENHYFHHGLVNVVQASSGNDMSVYLYTYICGIHMYLHIYIYVCIMV